MNYPALLRSALVALSRNKMRSVLCSETEKIRKDEMVVNRPRAAEVLKTLPTLED